MKFQNLVVGFFLSHALFGALPPYLPEESDFAEVCTREISSGKKVFVSVGREICGRCQKFYGMVERGEINIDTNRYTFIRLNIDAPVQREYFVSMFDTPTSKLPFVGVVDDVNQLGKPCLSGSHTPQEYQKLIPIKEGKAKKEK